MKSTTIFEISKILNISTSTVSRALKNHPDISPQTKAKVLEMAKKLNYEPNLFAVSLRQDKSRELAIIAPALSGFFYDSFISAVESEAKAAGYTVIVLLSGNDPEVEMQNLKICKQRRVAGIFLCVTSRTSDNSLFEFISNATVPVIFFDKIPRIDKTVAICANDRAAAELAAKALLDKSKKNILSIFGDPDFSITRNRLDAFKNSFIENPDVFNQIVYAKTSSEAEKLVYKAFEQSGKPDAIFCMSDELLIGVMKAIQVLNLSIPKQVGVIAISNGFFPTLYHPEISYVETSGYKLGSHAMKSFMNVLESKEGARHIYLEPVYVEGGSL